MPLIHKKFKPSIINPIKADPTRTATIRRQFSQQLSGRLTIIAQRIRKLVADENALGIGLQLNTRWIFHTTSQQVQQFQKWFIEQCQELLYQQEENSWWKEYVQRAYEQGAGNTLKQWSKNHLNTEFLTSSFGNPVQIERVKTLAARVLTELKNVTQAMATEMSRSLVDGLAQGKSPREVARDLTKSVDGLGKNRSLMIARTETVRAHAEGQLDSLENLGMQNVGVMVEWSTSGLGHTKVTGSKRKGTQRGGNPSPCSLCAPMSGVVFTIEQARGLIPRHPNCLCSFLPAGVGEDTSQQKIGKKQVSAALTASIRAELPTTKKRTLAEQRSRTSWVGADLKVNSNPNHDKLGRFAHGAATAKALADTLVYSAMKRIESRAEFGAAVSISQLRKEFPKLNKEAFDSLLQQLVPEGKFTIMRHDYVASLTPDEKHQLLKWGDDHYNAISRREGHR